MPEDRLEWPPFPLQRCWLHGTERHHDCREHWVLEHAMCDSFYPEVSWPDLHGFTWPHMHDEAVERWAEVLDAWLCVDPDNRPSVLPTVHGGSTPCPALEFSWNEQTIDWNARVLESLRAELVRRR